jgi:hypothetical protein
MKKGVNRFEISFAYNWPLFVILPLVSGFAISYLMGIYHRPLPYETINLFVASSAIKNDDFCTDIQLRFAEKNLKEVTTTQSNPSDFVFDQKLRVVGYQRSDLFLLPESVLEEINPGDILLPFSEDLINNFVPLANPTYYVAETFNFGVLIKGAAENSWLEPYIDFLAEDYYLCLNVTSKNIGDYGMYDNAEYDLALHTFAYLLGGGQ